jgi:hypothetical protein
MEVMKMHSLIDRHMVETIRTTGKMDKSLPDRKDVLDAHGLPYDRKAENVIISGCALLPLLPHVLCSLSRIYDQKKFSYTFLSKEYCCGNYVYRPAIKARDEAALAECRELSKEFVAGNLKQARDLGAKRIVIFCSPCYPVFKHSFPQENIVFYPATINELMEPLSYNKEIDYYAGCYKLHRKFAPTPMDLQSTNEIFSKMQGLNVNRISAPKCCFKPDGLSHMVDNVRTNCMVHVCTGCYGQALQNMPQEKGVDVLMLPEFVEMVINS